MKKYQQRTVTVRNGQKLYELINEIVETEKLFCLIDIDKELVNCEIVKDGENYKFNKDSYDFIVSDQKDGWYFLFEIIDSQGEMVYSIRNPYFEDYLNGKCDFKIISMRKYGSKTPIGEE